MSWTVYLLECRDGSLYCGITNNLAWRLKTHQSGKGSKYVRSRLPIKLVWSESGWSQNEAMKREREIKRMKKKDKVAMIESKQREKWQNFALDFCP